MYLLMEWLLQPLSIIYVLLLLTLVTWVIAGPKPIVPFVLFCTSITLFFAICMPFVANALVYKIETARKNPAYCDTINDAPMVILGGGLNQYVETDSHYETLNPDSLIRTLSAPAYGNASTHYYVMGGGGNGRTLGDSMKAVLVDMNVDPDKVTAETNSYSTYQNATALSAFIPPAENPKIFMLTSMMHAYRAAATFEKIGYQVCHVGVDIQYTEAAFPAGVLPYLEGLQKSTFAFHELTALILYKAKGFM